MCGYKVKVFIEPGFPKAEVVRSLLQIVEHIDKNGVYYQPEPEDPASWLEESLWPHLGGEEPPF
jgi:hypothetical protein